MRWRARAFSSEVDTGSREENASTREPRAPFRFHRNGKALGRGRRHAWWRQDPTQFVSLHSIIPRDGLLASRRSGPPDPLQKKRRPDRAAFPSRVASVYPPLPPITARTVLSGPKSSALST
ncbi:hypothetical protein CWS35_02075 [Bradyrhizobium sp. SK17]|nr:hypothetical protein CWS35_02075 [Bradyrhizobium sp. SK17]